MFNMLDHLPGVVNAGDPLAKRYPGKDCTLETCPDTGVRLVHRTPGYHVAGSAMRLQKTDAWGAVYEFDGARRGHWFNTPGEARASYDRVRDHRARMLALKSKRAA